MGQLSKFVNHGMLNTLNLVQWSQKKKIVNRSFFSALIITSIMTILIPRKVGSLEPKDLISLLTYSTPISHLIMTKLYMK